MESITETIIVLQDHIPEVLGALFALLVAVGASSLLLMKWLEKRREKAAAQWTGGAG